jgi:rhodanese-related sulfurtransferase
MKINEITAKEAFQLIHEGALLVDVREKDEVSQMSFQVKNCVNIPFSSFDDNYNELPQTQKIIFACHLGIRSSRVAQFMLIQGWDEEKVYNLDGGIVAWEKEKLPTKTAARSFSYSNQPITSCGCGNNSTGSCC